MLSRTRSQRRVLVLLVALTLISATTAGLAIAGTSSENAPSCGVERWAVKTLQDPAGRALNLSVFKNTTVAALRARTVKRGLAGSRGSGVASTVYQVRARLVGAKLEEDNDIHLVIKGVTTSGTMIVEFPLVTCASRATAGAKLRMKNARNAFLAACGMPGDSSFSQLSGSATIRGAGFFDFLHGQTGVAPNGIELHPVLRFTNATCSGGSRPSPPPPTTPQPPKGNCAASYPSVCIPPPPPDLDCGDIPYRNFKVRWDVPDPDPHHFDGDRDGVGCET